MIHTTNSKKPITLRVPVIREKLRETSLLLSEQLSRSVARQTSVDALPCPEYREEVHREAQLMSEILFIQQCRATLESAINKGAARLTFTSPNGEKKVVRFCITNSQRVKAYGLSV